MLVLENATVIVGLNGETGLLGQCVKSQWGIGALLSQDKPQNTLAPQFHCTVAISAASLEQSQGGTVVSSIKLNSHKYTLVSSC